MAFDLYGSGTPARVLCLEAGAGRWDDVLAHLQHAVARGMHVIRTPLADGRWYHFDFARMLRCDEADPELPAAALAWIDEAGNRFFRPDTGHAELEVSSSNVVGEDEAASIVLQ